MLASGEKIDFLLALYFPPDTCNYIMFDLQAVIREILLLALDDSHKKICTAISMAVASIAEYDWPDFWPDLLPFLLRLISNQANLNGGKHFL